MMSTTNGALPSSIFLLAAARRLMARWPTVGLIALFVVGAGLVCWLYVSEVARNLERSKPTAAAGSEQAPALRLDGPGEAKKLAAEVTSIIAPLKQGLHELSAGLEQVKQELQNVRDRSDKQIHQLAADLTEVQKSAQRESEQVRHVAEELATNIEPVKRLALQQQHDSAALEQGGEQIGPLKAVTAEVGQLKQAIGTLTTDLDKVRQTLAQEGDNSASRVSRLVAELTEANQSAQREREKVDRLELRLTSDLDQLKELLNRESNKNEKLVRGLSADVAEMKKALGHEGEKRIQTADGLTAELVQLKLAVRGLTADLGKEKQARQQYSGKDGEQPQPASAERSVTKQSLTPEAVEIPRRERDQQNGGPEKQLATRSDVTREGSANGSRLARERAPATGQEQPERPSADVDDATFQRLMSRASLLLSQGDIGAARVVLERAAETGNARALFALAETFDPVVLSAWGALGTRGDAARAQELYAKALAGGVQEAKSRLTR
jgi:ABC-type transporter Mla subunit MlaD